LGGQGDEPALGREVKLEQWGRRGDAGDLGIREEKLLLVPSLPLFCVTLGSYFPCPGDGRTRWLLSSVFLLGIWPVNLAGLEPH
jgi:hypothetical protein